MNKFSFKQELKKILFVQDFRANPEIYKQLRMPITGGHIGIDISHGDLTPCYALYEGDVVYTQFDTIVILTDSDENGICLEISYAHMKEQKVIVGDRVKKNDLIGLQDCVGPSVMWQEQTSEQDKIAWSHQHIGFREAKRLQTTTQDKNYYWNYQKFSKIPYEVIEYDSTVEHFRDPNNYSRKLIYRIADAIEKVENMDKSFNNPGALRYSPYQSGTKNGFAVFNTYKDGYNALVYQLALACTGKTKVYNINMSLIQFLSVYAPKSDGNQPTQYANNVVLLTGLRNIDEPISDWNLTEIEWLKKYNSNSFLGYPETAIKIDSSGKLSSILEFFKYLWNQIMK